MNEFSDPETGEPEITEADAAADASAWAAFLEERNGGTLVPDHLRAEDA